MKQATQAAPVKERSLSDSLHAFYLTGRVPEGTGLVVGLGEREPATVAAYRSTDHRGPWPLVFFAKSSAKAEPPGSLTDLIDGLIAGLEAGEVGERQKRILLRVERSLKAGSGPIRPALAGVQEALANDVKTSWQADLQAVFELVESALGDGALMQYGPESLLFLATRSASEAYARNSEPWFDEVAALESALAELADVEANEADTVPEHLQHLAGGAFSDAFDFEALGSLMAEAPHINRLPADRLERITSALEVLRAARRSLRDDRQLEPVSIGAAANKMRDRVERVAVLAQYMTVSRLESQDQFDPTWHPGLIHSMDGQYLSDEDRSVIPPVLVRIAGDRASDADLAAAGAMLEGRAPHKVLLFLETPRDAPGAKAWELVDRALLAPDTWVGQFCLSDSGAITEAVAEAMTHPGPSILAVYGPEDYLTAAAACEGRAVPGFVCKPAGHPWADRLLLKGNPEPEADWSAGTGAEDQFCWADFAALQPSLKDLYLVLPSDAQSGSLVPASQFFDLGTEEASSNLPYINVSLDGVGRETAVVAAPLMAMMHRARDRWRRLRELGGVANSFARQAVSEERERHDAELAKALSEAEAAHRAAMAQAVSGLAAEIVANIAGSLLGVDGADAKLSLSQLTGATETGLGTVAAAAAPTTAAQAAAEPDPASPESEPEEEEALALDEPWIETVRCTSCNECTDLNSMLFGYDENKQAFIKDASAGSFRDLVRAAEKCPALIIHPGRPLNADEPNLEDLIARAAPFQ